MCRESVTTQRVPASKVVCTTAIDASKRLWSTFLIKRAHFLRSSPKATVSPSKYLRRRRGEANRDRVEARDALKDEGEGMYGTKAIGA
jgi:hypothetical protein